MRSVVFVAVLLVALTGGTAAGKDKPRVEIGTAVTHTIWPSLAVEARYVASHGGVTGTGHGAATGRMRALSRRLVVKRFAKSPNPHAVSTALCIVRAESGFNPGAISRTSDYGLAQFNRPTWERKYDWNRILDPVYNIGVMWAMSSRGTDWSAWTGTYGRGICQ